MSPWCNIRSHTSSFCKFHLRYSPALLTYWAPSFSKCQYKKTKLQNSKNLNQASDLFLVLFFLFLDDIVLECRQTQFCGCKLYFYHMKGCIIGKCNWAISTRVQGINGLCTMYNVICSCSVIAVIPLSWWFMTFSCYYRPCHLWFLIAAPIHWVDI